MVVRVISASVFVILVASVVGQTPPGPIGALPDGRTKSKAAVAPTLAAPTPSTETVVTMPGLDPTDRTPRSSKGRVSYYGPGVRPGESVEWREQLAVFANPANPLTRNTIRVMGWNMSPGSPTDPKKATLGLSFENSFQPGWVKDETWSEFHLAFGGVDRLPRRPFTFAGVHETGKTDLVLQADTGSIRHEQADGRIQSILSWRGPDALSQFVKTRHEKNNVAAAEQLDASGRHYIRLPFVNDRNEVVIGHNPVLNQTAPLRVRELILEDVAGTGGAVTLFLQGGQLKFKRPDGSVSPVR